MNGQEQHDTPRWSLQKPVATPQHKGRSILKGSMAGHRGREAEELNSQREKIEGEGGGNLGIRGFIGTSDALRSETEGN